MAQTIKYQLGGKTHALVLTGTRFSSTQAKEHLCDELQATLVDFGSNERPSLEEQLDERLKHAGVTNFEIIEQ